MTATGDNVCEEIAVIRRNAVTFDDLRLIIASLQGAFGDNHLVTIQDASRATRTLDAIERERKAQHDAVVAPPEGKPVGQTDGFETRKDEGLTVGDPDDGTQPAPSPSIRCPEGTLRLKNHADFAQGPGSLAHAAGPMPSDYPTHSLSCAIFSRAPDERVCTCAEPINRGEAVPSPALEESDGAASRGSNNQSGSEARSSVLRVGAPPAASSGGEQAVRRTGVGGGAAVEQPRNDRGPSQVVGGEGRVGAREAREVINGGEAAGGSGRADLGDPERACDSGTDTAASSTEDVTRKTLPQEPAASPSLAYAMEALRQHYSVLPSHAKQRAFGERVEAVLDAWDRDYRRDAVAEAEARAGRAEAERDALQTIVNNLVTDIGTITDCRFGDDVRYAIRAVVKDRDEARAAVRNALAAWHTERASVDAYRASHPGCGKGDPQWVCVICAAVDARRRGETK